MNSPGKTKEREHYYYVKRARIQSDDERAKISKDVAEDLILDPATQPIPECAIDNSRASGRDKTPVDRRAAGTGVEREHQAPFMLGRRGWYPICLPTIPAARLVECRRRRGAEAVSFSDDCS